VSAGNDWFKTGCAATKGGLDLPGRGSGKTECPTRDKSWEVSYKGLSVAQGRSKKGLSTKGQGDVRADLRCKAFVSVSGGTVYLLLERGEKKFAKKRIVKQNNQCAKGKATSWGGCLSFRRGRGEGGVSLRQSTVKKKISKFTSWGRMIR